MNSDAINRAQEHFGDLLKAQMERMTRIKAAPDWVDFSALSPIKIGILGGDGIGPYIAKEAKWLLMEILKDEVAGGRVVINESRCRSKPVS